MEKEFLNKPSEINIKYIEEFTKTNTIGNINDEHVHDLLIYADYINDEKLKKYLIKHIKRNLLIRIQNLYIYEINIKKEETYQIFKMNKELINEIIKDKFIISDREEYSNLYVSYKDLEKSKEYENILIDN